MIHSWRPLLWSAFYGGSDYGFAALHPRDSPIARIVQKNNRDDMVAIDNENNPQWIVGGTGDRTFFGRWGLVGDFLGWEHPAARDSVKRDLEFFLGYTSTTGAAVPQFDDLGGVEATIRADLGQFWNQVRTTGRTTDNPGLTSFDFDCTKHGSHIWDTTALELKNSRASGYLIIARNGATRFMVLPVPKSAEEAGTIPSQKGNSSTKKTARRQVNTNPSIQPDGSVSYESDGSEVRAEADSNRFSTSIETREPSLIEKWFRILSNFRGKKDDL